MLSNSSRDSRSRFLLWVVLCLVLTLANAGAAAQEANSRLESTPEDATIDIQTAPVKLDGKTLFDVRGQTAYPAEKRAQLVADRIEAVAKDRGFDPQSLRLNETQFATAYAIHHATRLRLQSHGDIYVFQSSAIMPENHFSLRFGSASDRSCGSGVRNAINFVHPDGADR